MNRCVISTEGQLAPILLSLYGDNGLTGGRVELSPVAALQLALDLLACSLPKLAAATVARRAGSPG